MKIIDINQLREEASRCFTCKVPKCKKNCPISTQIPEVISLFKENKIEEAGKILFENNINILDISQTIMQDIFTMVMLVDVKDSSIEFKELVEKMRIKGDEIGVDIKVCHEEIFNSMHRI